MSLTVTVCAPLSLDPRPVLSAAVADLAEDVEICYPADLLPRQRFVADHRGEDGFARSGPQEEQWRELLARTDVALGIPGDSPDGIRQLAARAPRLRWIQGTAAGTGEQLAGAGVDADVLSRLTVTSAAGVHARPLAEFAVFGLLAFAKDIDRLTDLSHRREWGDRWPMRQLSTSTVAVVGMGGVGREVARLLGGLGTTVYGVHRRPPAGDVEGLAIDVPVGEVAAVFPRCDAVVMALPGTPETRGMLGADLLALLPDHAVVVNVGRGSVVDTAALVSALDSGRLRGAVLDVTEVEPLPSDSALWGRPDVILSPHTAALTAEEDDRIVDLFGENLRRFLTGQPLRNLVEPARGY